MKPLNERQKKAAWIIAGVILFLHFLPGMVRSSVQAFAARQHRVAAPAKPSPYPAQPIAPTPPLKEPALSPAVQARYAGTYEAIQYLPNNDECRIRLELRPSPDQPASMAGYETRTCFNIPTPIKGELNKSAADMARDATPVSTVLTGSLIDGDIAFSVDKSVGSSPFVCPLASYTVSAFGQKSIVAQWRAVDCPPDHVVLTRVGG